MMRRPVLVIIAPACLVGLAVLVATLSPHKWRLAEYEILACAGLAYLAAIGRGRFRNMATVAASLALGLAAIEAVSAASVPDYAKTSKGLFVPDPVLGWRPAAPGVYHASRNDLDGKLIYDVDYTIDGNRLRQTLSGEAGPTIAFFGDSFTFGEGVNDADTLPQAFADVDGRRLRVLNFGFSGYGPQQFLRAVETGLFDPLLSGAKVFVLQTSAWHAERTSCLVSFTLHAPRYVLQDGVPVYHGPCASGLMLHLKEFLYNSDTVRKFFVPAIAHLNGSDIDLYVAEVIRAAQISTARYHVPTLVLYLPAGPAYLGNSGRTDADIEAAFRKAGLPVLDGSVSAAQFPPGTALTMAGDGHPTAIVQHARARMLHDFMRAQFPALLATEAAAARD